MGDCDAERAKFFKFFLNETDEGKVLTGKLSKWRESANGRLQGVLEEMEPRTVKEGRACITKMVNGESVRGCKSSLKTFFRRVFLPELRGGAVGKVLLDGR